MKKFGSKSGFTLVELIVVIAILGILAGIAVPAYSGYIKKANEAADYSALDAVKTAAVFVAVDTKAPSSVDVTEIQVTSASSKVTVKAKIDGATSETTLSDLDISAYCTVPAFKSDTFKTSGATWTPADGWKPTSSGG